MNERSSMNVQQSIFTYPVHVQLREDGFYEAAFPAWTDAPKFTSRYRKKAVAYALEWLASELAKPLTTPVD